MSGKVFAPALSRRNDRADEESAGTGEFERCSGKIEKASKEPSKSARKNSLLSGQN
jgi:hypothetical protein